MEIRVSRVDEAAARLIWLWNDMFPFLLIASRGVVHTSGWSNVELRPTSFAEGVLSLDMVATPPPDGSEVQSTVTKLVTSLSLPVYPRLVRTVQVAAAGNFVAVAVEGDEGASVTGEGLPLPWPFPWLYRHDQNSS